MFCKKIPLKSGGFSWMCVADGPADPVTGERKQIPRRGKTKREAMDRVNEAINSLKNHGVDQRISKTIPFDAVAEDWIAVYALTGKKRNSVRVREKEIKMLNKCFAKVPIGDIDHEMYQNALIKLSKSYARSTLLGAHGAAGMIFEYAIRTKKIKDDPTIGAVVPKKRKTIEEIKENPVEGMYLEHDELEEFLSVVQKYGLYLDLERFYTLAFSGMRSGELCALQKDDALAKEGIIKINKTLYSETNNMRLYELTTPKTDGSVRDIQMEKPIMDMVMRVIRRNDKHKLQYRHLYEDFHDENFIFCRDNGYPFVPKNILDRMNRLVEKTSIKKNATPHIFRHTHISMLTEAGVELPTIMERVGHEDMETTMKVYTHVTNKMKKDASVKINNLFGNILENVNFK